MCRHSLLTLSALLALVVTAIAPPTAAADLAPDGLPISGYQKGFFIHSSERDFALHTYARLQTRYNVEVPESDLIRPVSNTFLIPRARLFLRGHAFRPELRYFFQAAFEQATADLRDFYIDYAFLPQTLHLRMGRWKRPFSRQRIGSGSTMIFVERSVTDDVFGHERDLGFMLHNNYLSGAPLTWAVGVFNGTGRGLAGPDDHNSTTRRFEPAVMARVDYNHGKINPFAEGDLEGGPLRFGIGLGALTELDQDGDADSRSRAILDFMVKWNGLATSGGVFAHAGRRPFDALHDQVYRGWGFHLQASYLVLDWLLPAVRYARVDPRGLSNVRQEANLALSILFYGHDVTWQFDGSYLHEESRLGDLVHYRLRTQVQLTF